MQNMLMNNIALLNLTQQLIEQLQKQSNQKAEGIFTTACPNVDVFYQAHGQQHQPTLYTPGFVFLFSGEKSTQLGQMHYVYNATQGLLLTGVYPVYCDASASEQEPLIGIQIRFDRMQVAQLMHQITQRMTEIQTIEHAVTKPTGFLAVRMTPAIQVALYGLLSTLRDEVACDLFMPTHIQNLIYSALDQAEVRAFIAGWVAQDGRFAQFLQATDFILRQLNQPITLKDIAAHAGMSIPTLQRTFKHYAADSPMQYIKKVRLSHAYVHLTQTTCTVQSAAYAVGYESVSQFSREFKRYYGQSPQGIKRG